VRSQNAQVLDALPDAYVGTEITPVVQFLCAELAAAFEVCNCRVLLHLAVRLRTSPSSRTNECRQPAKCLI